MATVQEALAIAVRHHQAGELSQAERIYRQILDVQPDHAHSLHLLGVIAHQVGKQQAAIELIRRATAIEPGNPDYYNNLGNALTAEGKQEEAESAFRRALQIKPDHADAQYNLGNSLIEQGEVDAAMADRFEVFDAPRADVIEFVRNPVSLGALANVLDPAETVVVILIPLLDPTRDFWVDFDAFFISLDSAGSVVAGDYPDSTIDRLDELFEFGREEGRQAAEILAIAAQGVNADPPSPVETEAVEILFGG